MLGRPKANEHSPPIDILTQLLNKRAHASPLGLTPCDIDDTPKIVPLLLVIKGLGIEWGMAAVALGMAAGGILMRQQQSMPGAVRCEVAKACLRELWLWAWSRGRSVPPHP